MKKELVLYVIVRNDLASLTPGKVAAQVSHASTAFMRYYANRDSVEEWCDRRGFGTAVILSTDIDQLKSINEQARHTAFACGLVADPEYALVDGRFVHNIKLITCSYLFGSREALFALVGHLELYNA